MLDLAIDLGKRFFAAHGQYGVTQPDEDRQQTGEMSEVKSVQPPHGVRSELQILRPRQRRQWRVADPRGVAAPTDQDHYHHGGDLHDAHRLVAGFRNALDVLPPEIQGDADREGGSR